MIKHVFCIPFLLAICFFAGCKPSISADELYGKWKYTKVAQPNAHPPDSVRSDDLARQSPYIQFSKNNTLEIIWGGKMLSHGKFTVDGRDIRYTESLEDSTTRQFPFWVSELNDKEIVFETKGADGSRVTAVRE
jgi:hypothetical protein